MSHDKGYHRKITVTINFITGNKILEFSKTFNDFFLKIILSFPGLENEIIKFHDLSMFSMMVPCEVIKRITTWTEYSSHYITDLFRSSISKCLRHLQAAYTAVMIAAGSAAFHPNL